jgi:aminopeptidase N
VDSALLHDWLAGQRLPAGLAMDEELRWAVLGRLAVLGDLTQARIDEEYGRDRGAAGAEHAARCRAALPTREAKGRAWDALMLDDSLSNRQLFSIAEGFWQPGQDAVTESYVDRYGAEVAAMARRRPSQVVRRLAGSAYPRLAVRGSTLEMSQRLLSREDLTPALRRAVVDAADELRRSLAARARADGGTP